MASRLEVALSELEKDSDHWSNCADGMTTASYAEFYLMLGTDDMGYLCEQFGVVDQYDDLRRKLVQLLRDGSRRFDALADALDAVVDGYRSDEKTSTDELRDAV